jgi:hypothetical protein
VWAVVVCTEPFESLARLNARARGAENLDVIVLPHPLGVRLVPEVQELGRLVADRLAALVDHEPM